MDRSALKLTLSNGLRDYRIDYIIAHCYQLFKLYQDSTDQVRVRQPVAEVWRVVGRGRGTPGQHHDAAPLKLGDCVDSTGHWVTGDTGQCCVQLQLWTVDMWHRRSEARTGLRLVRAPGPLSGAAPATSLVLTTTPGRRSARPRRGVSTELPSLLHS